jgi:hypothetical protein
MIAMIAEQAIPAFTLPPSRLIERGSVGAPRNATAAG